MEQISENTNLEMRAKIAEELEDIITDKNFPRSYGDPENTVEKIKNREKIPYHDWLYNRVIRVCQEFGLRHEQIDSVLDETFDSIPEDLLSSR